MHDNTIVTFHERTRTSHSCPSLLYLNTYWGLLLVVTMVKGPSTLVPHVKLDAEEMICVTFGTGP